MPSHLFHLFCIGYDYHALLQAAHLQSQHGFDKFQGNLSARLSGWIKQYPDDTHTNAIRTLRKSLPDRLTTRGRAHRTSSTVLQLPSSFVAVEDDPQDVPDPLEGADWVMCRNAFAALSDVVSDEVGKLTLSFAGLLAQVQLSEGDSRKQNPLLGNEKPFSELGVVLPQILERLGAEDIEPELQQDLEDDEHRVPSPYFVRGQLTSFRADFVKRLKAFDKRQHGVADDPGGTSGGAPTDGEEGGGSITVGTDQPNVFRWDGAAWTIRFLGSDVRHSPDRLGYRYIRDLMARPGEKLSAQELVNTHHTSERRQTTHDPDEVSINGSRDDGDVIEDIGIQKCREAYEFLRQDLEKAREKNDAATIERVQHEMHDIFEYVRKAGFAPSQVEKVLDPKTPLREAMGARRRIPKVGSKKKRVAGSVTVAINRAIQKIKPFEKPLGIHLEKSIKTGGFCIYDPEVNIDWKLD